MYLSRYARPCLAVWQQDEFCRMRHVQYYLQYITRLTLHS